MGQKETLKVLFAGNTFREKKGVRYLIEGVALARQAGVNLELRIVGGGKIEKSGDEKVKEDVFGLISRLGLEEITVIILSFRFVNCLKSHLHLMFLLLRASRLPMVTQKELLSWSNK